MTITQFMDILDGAIAYAEANPTSRWKRRRERSYVLRLTAPRALGCVGVADGTDETKRPVYAYTLAQCRAMRDEIAQAALDDYEATRSAVDDATA